MSLLQTHSHRRLNPLTGEWVLVSPHRSQRPWQGQTEPPASEDAAAYDPHCYLCPGNKRAHGAINAAYEHTFVFDNDFPALQAEAVGDGVNEGDLIVAEAEPGICRVICFSPRHDLTLSRMTVAEIARVVGVWQQQYRELGALPDVGAVQIFENRGAMMGASNPHPHCQVWATRTLPNEMQKELAAQAAYWRSHRSQLLVDYVGLERAAGERVVVANDHFTALVPFWAVWPYETMVLPHRPMGALDELTTAETGAVADILRALTTRYDNLFETPFPYSMGFHQRPTDGEPHPGWQLHAHFLPPLLRSATVRKFMVGFELLGEPQRDITPEEAAQRLRALPSVHYRDRR